MTKLNLQNFKTLPLVLKNQVPAKTYYILPAESSNPKYVVFSITNVNMDTFVKYTDITPFYSVFSLPSYLWVKRLTEDYFPGYFTLVNFSKPRSVILYVKPNKLVSILSFLKYSFFFRASSLMDLWATDFPTRKARFEITYCLLSTKKNERIYIRSFFSEWDVVPSVTHLYSSANWLEREVWDLFGIPFSGHPDLRRILTDYGFLGFPLRKDFPLTGFFEIRYDDSSRRVVSESINLIQELRLFFFSTPWKNL